jgi:hypothetical protein
VIQNAESSKKPRALTLPKAYLRDEERGDLLEEVSRFRIEGITEMTLTLSPMNSHAL